MMAKATVDMFIVRVHAFVALHYINLSVLSINPAVMW